MMGLPALVLSFAQLSAAACVEVPDGVLVADGMGQRLDEFMLARTEEGFSGAVLVANAGEILLKKGYGDADRERGVPNTPETLFNVASVAKTFTSAVVMTLVEEGLLSLDDRLERFFEPFPRAKAATSVHHLLTHTAGLAVRGTSLDYQDRESFVESMRQAPIESAPGAAFRYTNAGYTLLAAIVEEVTAQRFEAVLQERVFEPACMTSTAYVWDQRLRGAPFAIGYSGETVESLSPRPPQADVWGNRGPGSVATTVGDLYRWIAAIDAGAVNSRASIDTMFTAYVGDEGYGWHVIDSDHGRLVRRGGGLPEFESSLRWYRDQDLVIVVAINNHIGFRVPVVTGIEEIALGSGEWR